RRPAGTTGLRGARQLVEVVAPPVVEETEETPIAEELQDTGVVVEDGAEPAGGEVAEAVTGSSDANMPMENETESDSTDEKDS
ncbi:MAG: hypothetical protein AB7G88_13250, partial [Thermomicrobiales bacterium]